MVAGVVSPSTAPSMNWHSFLGRNPSHILSCFRISMKTRLCFDKPLNISAELLRQRDTCRIAFAEEAHEVRTLLVLLEKLRKHLIQHQGAFRQLWKKYGAVLYQRVLSRTSAIWTHPGILSSSVPSLSSLILLSGHFFVVTMATCRPPGIGLPTAFLNRVFTTVGDADVPEHPQFLRAVYFESKRLTVPLLTRVGCGSAACLDVERSGPPQFFFLRRLFSLRELGIGLP